MREEPLGKEDVMSKSSRRNRRDQLQKQELEEVRKEVQQNPRVNPVPTERKANGKNKVPPTRKQSPYVAAAQEAAKQETEVDEACEQTEAGVPEWLDRYLKYQSEFTMQLASQIVEDHQVLTDHEWRLHDIEGRLGIVPESVEPAEEVEPEELAEDSDATQPIPVIESEPEIEEFEIEEPDLEPETKEIEGEDRIPAPKGAIPREMYEAQVFENGKWIWHGPYPRISRAEQATGGDLSKIRIVQVWYDPKRETVIRHLSVQELDRYCK